MLTKELTSAAALGWMIQGARRHGIIGNTVSVLLEFDGGETIKGEDESIGEDLSMDCCFHTMVVSFHHCRLLGSLLVVLWAFFFAMLLIMSVVAMLHVRAFVRIKCVRTSSNTHTNLPHLGDSRKLLSSSLLSFSATMVIQ